MSFLSNPIPAAILWHDGMLLTPEHFHELSARNEAMLEHLAASLPFHWGASRVHLDESQLSQGKVVLLGLEAVLPDGFQVRLQRTEDSPVLLDLETLDASFRQRPFQLYLTVFAVKEDGAVARELRFTEATAIASPLQEEAADESTPIPRLRPRFQLLASFDTPSEKYVSVPLARIGMRHEMWVELDDYQPPVRTLPEDSPLLRSVGKVLLRIRDLAVAIHTRWSSLSALERGEGDTAQRDLWRKFVASLPACEALLAAGSVVPFNLYLAVCALAGEASTLTEDAVPPLFTPYNHADIAASFTQVLDYIEQVLTFEEASDFAAFPFRYENEIFSIDFLPEWAGRELVLALRGRQPGDPALRLWAETALIGARSLQGGMRIRRVLGTQRRFLPMERGLRVGPSVQLFMFGNDGEYLIPGEPLDVASGPHADLSQLPLELTLYVRQRA